MARGIEFSVHKPSRKQIAGLGTALKKLGLVPAAAEIRSAENKDVRTAIEELQRRAGLNVDGEVTVETLEVLNGHLAHAELAASKGRTHRVQEMLARVGARIDGDELAARRLGPSTEEAIRELQHRAGLIVDGLMTEDVFERLANETLKVRLGAKTQVGRLHRKLLHVARIARLEANIDPDELRSKKVGETTTALIRAFQDKYKLPATGGLDVATMDRIDSVAASRGVHAKHLKTRAVDDLVVVTRNLRLNMKSEAVGSLQKSLAYLGHAVDEREFHDKAFGASTRAAVLAFQKRNGLPPTGHVEGATRERMNAAILDVNPAAARTTASHRVRGAVRDDLWRGRPGVRVQLVEKTLGGAGSVLAERRAAANGFFDVPYAPPTNTVDGQIKAAYHLTVRVLDEDGRELESRDLFNPTPIAWSNFTAGDQPYRGPSELENRQVAIAPFLGDIMLADLQESPARRDITFVAQQAQLSTGDVMRIALAHRAARQLGDAALGADVFYAFIRQSLPPTLPGDLVIATEGWSLIDQLVERAVEGVVFMEPVLQVAALDAAAKANLIPIATARARTQILAALEARRRTFALERPILDGNGTLASVLAASIVDPQRHATIADAFLAHRGLGPDFWHDLDARAEELGGSTAIADLRRTIQIGHVAKNHAPTLTFLKAAIGGSAHPSLRTVPDLAKLAPAEWVALIQENGGTVPDGTDGATEAEKVDVYAATMAAQAERLFPAVAVTSRLVPGGAHGLTELEGVRAFVETHADLSFAETNLDKLVKDAGLDVPAVVLRQAKAVQRVHRIAPSAAASAALLEEKIHQSAALVALGRRRFVDTMNARGIERHDALTLGRGAGTGGGLVQDVQNAVLVTCARRGHAVPLDLRRWGNALRARWGAAAPRCSRAGAWSSLREGELVDEVVDMRSREVEALGDGADVPAHGLELAQQQVSLVEACRFVEGRWAIDRAVAVAQMADLNLRGALGGGPAERVAEFAPQLADVAVAAPVARLKRQAQPL